MDQPTILPLNDPQATLETVGGKGQSLARMLRAALPVPAGFHVTTAAYRQFVTANGLQARIREALTAADPTQPSTLDATSVAIGTLFQQAELPADLRRAIVNAYERLCQAPPSGTQPLAVAVRSSATAEDLPDASFAGQQETYLNIRGADSVVAAVRRCWASLWTARAIAYRLKNHIDQESVALAVVVQELVAAEAAGILFTANPVNGVRHELVINAAWGLGEAVVSGVVTPDTYVVDKRTLKLVRRTVAEKLVMTVRTDDGTREDPVPSSRRKMPALTDDGVAALARLGARIEDFYGRPMDVEWTWTAPSAGAPAESGFAIVQARPITVLPPDWTLPDPDGIYSRGSLAEHTPSPVTPLFATFGLRLANEATTGMWERLIGKDGPKLMAGGGFYTPINGFVFGGVRMKGNVVRMVKMSASQAGPMMKGSVPRWQAARQRFADVVDLSLKKPVAELSSAELLEEAAVVFSAASRYFTDIQTVLPAASMSETILTRFYDAFVKRKQDPAIAAFLLGFETTTSRAETDLFELAAWLKSEPELADYVLSTPTDRLWRELQTSRSSFKGPADVWDVWRERFMKHVATFGRTAYEFDFSYPTPAEAPAPMLDALKAYLGGQAQDPQARRAAAVERRERLTLEALDRLGWPIKGWFEKLLRWTQATAPMREDSIFDMGMGHPHVRRLLGELAERLVAHGALAEPDEIYWLHEQELRGLIAALESGERPMDHSRQILERKAEWQGWRKITPPIMLPEKSGWQRLIHGGEAETKDGRTILKGIGTSVGTVTAPARVLLGPEDFDSMKPGDVLVAVTTTPAWTPLFALASAVVTDIGGPLSHSSIVAREYGIPAVMAARGATQHIRNGQMLTVDGAAGTVSVASE